jgi:hypothetical protein
MNIGTADGSFENLYEYIIDADFGNGHLFQPQPRFGL